MVAVKEKENVSYTMFSASVWWALRKKFNQSMPARVTENYLSGVLGIAANTARLTLIPPLKKMGLIDNDGKPTAGVGESASEKNGIILPSTY